MGTEATWAKTAHQGLAEGWRLMASPSLGSASSVPPDPIPAPVPFCVTPAAQAEGSEMQDSAAGAVGEASSCLPTSSSTTIPRPSFPGTLSGIPEALEASVPVQALPGNTDTVKGGSGGRGQSDRGEADGTVLSPVPLSLGWLTSCPAPLLQPLEQTSPHKRWEHVLLGDQPP